MALFFAILFGLIGGTISLVLQAAFISRRDKYVNSSFAIFLKKVGWFVAGFVMGAGFGGMLL
jgi:hypothetical protein